MSICPSIQSSITPSIAGSIPRSNALSYAPSNARTYVLTDKLLKLDSYLSLGNARVRVHQNPHFTGQITRPASATRGLAPAVVR